MTVFHTQLYEYPFCVLAFCLCSLLWKEETGDHVEGETEPLPQSGSVLW